MTALRYLPGQVVIFGRESLASRFDVSSISAFGELLESNRYDFGNQTRFLESFAVNVGEELRFLDIARSYQEVIGVSLNYVGAALSAAPPELKLRPGELRSRETTYCLKTTSAPTEQWTEFETFGKHLAALKSRITRAVIVVDVDPDHCLEVIRIASEGMAASQQSSSAEDLDLPAAIIGFTSRIDGTQITDLQGYCDRLLLAAMTVGEPDAIRTLALNMSVDFALVVNGYSSAGRATLESPDMLYSNRFFEQILDTVRNQLTYDKTVPAFFAAAGNRQDAGGECRVRLGFPASRPETIAVTIVATSRKRKGNATPGEWVDIPATSGLKPCLAIDVSRISLSNEQGSSFACAWMTGHYAAAGGDGAELKVLSKTAWLLKATHRVRLATKDHGLPCFAAALQDSKLLSTSPSEPNLLVANLNERFSPDFALYGSTAVVSELLRINGKSFRDIAPWAYKDLGDVDIAYAGYLDDEDLESVKEYVRDWFADLLGRTWVQNRKRPVDLHELDGLVSGSARLRSVTPVSQIFLTDGGAIDIWGGVEDLSCGSIRFYPLDNPDYWAKNSLHATGADCLGLNILEWIGITSLLRLICSSIDVPIPSADPASVEAVKDILSKQEAPGRTETLRLFGLGAKDMRERLPRRWERVETLMGSCARRGVVDPTLNELLERLQRLRTA